MRCRSAIVAALMLAACGSDPTPVTSGPASIRLERRMQLSAGPARGLAFSPDGRLLATTTATGAIRLWPMEGGAAPRLLRHHGGATSLAFSGDGALLATAGYDGRARVWRVADGALLEVLEGAAGTLWSVDVSPDGTRVAAAGEDKTVRVWRVSDGKLAASWPAHSLNIWEVRFSPDGRQLATSSFDRKIRLWDSATGRALRTLEGHGQAVVALDYSPDGKLLASGSDDSTVRLWRVADGAPLRTLEAGNHIYGVAFSRDGKRLATSGRARGSVGTFVHQLTGKVASGDVVHLWQVPGGRLLAAARQPEDAMYVAFSPKGDLIATASEDGSASLWRIR